MTLSQMAEKSPGAIFQKRSPHYSGSPLALVVHTKTTRAFFRFPSFVPADLVRFAERTRASFSLFAYHPIRLFAISSLTAGTSSLAISMTV